MTKLFMKNQYLIKTNYVEKKLNEDDLKRSNELQVLDDTRDSKIRQLQELINYKDVEFTKLENNVILENDFANIAIRIKEIMKPNECNILLNRHIEELKDKMV